MTEIEQPRSKALVEQRQIYARIHGAAAIAFASIEDRSIKLQNEHIDSRRGYDVDAWNSIYDYGTNSGLSPNGLKITGHYCREIAEGVKEQFEKSLITGE